MIFMKCPVNGCKRKREPRFIMCSSHWTSLEWQTKAALQRALAGGEDSEDFHEARRLAVREAEGK